MIRIAMSVTLLLIGSAGVAWADRVVEQPEDAYELALGDVIMPGGQAGSVIVKPCEECRSTSLRTDAGTLYAVNNRWMAYEDFMKAVDAMREQRGVDKNATVYIFFDVKSQHVNRMAVDYRAPNSGTQRGQEGRNSSRDER
jgi:hypothetical protein